LLQATINMMSKQTNQWHWCRTSHEYSFFLLTVAMCQ